MYQKVAANTSVEIRNKTFSFRVNIPGVCSVETDQFTTNNVRGCQTFHAPANAPYKRIRVSVPADSLADADFWYITNREQILPDLAPAIREDGSLGNMPVAPTLQTNGNVIVTNAPQVVGSPTWTDNHTYSYFLQNTGASDVLVSPYPLCPEGVCLVVPPNGGTLAIQTNKPLYAVHRAGDPDDQAGGDLTEMLRFFCTLS